MDYETFGEHQWADTGIFEFLKVLPFELKQRSIKFATPSEIARNQAVDELDINQTISWADTERDTSAWTGNDMQRQALQELYAMESAVKACNDETLLKHWRLLQLSDHFYYMCTKWFADGDVHKYFNPYNTPYEGFIAFMNALNDLALRVRKKLLEEVVKQQSLNVSKLSKNSGLEGFNMQSQTFQNIALQTSLITENPGSLAAEMLSLVKTFSSKRLSSNAKQD